ncbi:MAG: NeuD/PglB/VioB family sugar acetyltransferase [Aquabacterium sp.]
MAPGQAPTSSQVTVIGAGGHGRVVVDALRSTGWAAADITVRDDRAGASPLHFLGCHRACPACPDGGLAGPVHVALGSAQAREALLRRAAADQAAWLTVCHPRAHVAGSAAVGGGSFIAAMAVVGPDAQLGLGVIVNHGAVVDHDCVVGDFCHVAPNATLGGGVRLGRRLLIGAGAVVLPGLHLGDDVVVAAGAVVVNDLPVGARVAGVPARPMGDSE